MWLFQIVADLVEELFHGFAVAALYYLLKHCEFVFDVVELLIGARIEENLLQEVVVLRHQAVGNSHVTLECGAGRILVLHHTSKHQRACKRNRQRECYGLIVLIECVFEDVEMQLAIEVLEEHLAQMIALGDDDGILVREIAE